MAFDPRKQFRNPENGQFGGSIGGTDGTSTDDATDAAEAARQAKARQAANDMMAAITRNQREDDGDTSVLADDDQYKDALEKLADSQPEQEAPAASDPRMEALNETISGMRESGLDGDMPVVNAVTVEQLRNQIHNHEMDDWVRDHEDFVMQLGMPDSVRDSDRYVTFEEDSQGFHTEPRLMSYQERCQQVWDNRGLIAYWGAGEGDNGRMHAAFAPADTRNPFTGRQVGTNHMDRDMEHDPTCDGEDWGKMSDRARGQVVDALNGQAYDDWVHNDMPAHDGYTVSYDLSPDRRSIQVGLGDTDEELQGRMDDRPYASVTRAENGGYRIGYRDADGVESESIDLPRFTPRSTAVMQATELYAKHADMEREEAYESIDRERDAWREAHWDGDDGSTIAEAQGWDY